MLKKFPWTDGLCLTMCFTKYWSYFIQPDPPLKHGRLPSGDVSRQGEHFWPSRFSLSWDDADGWISEWEVLHVSIEDQERARSWDMWLRTASPLLSWWYSNLKIFYLWGKRTCFLLFLMEHLVNAPVINIHLWGLLMELKQQTASLQPQPPPLRTSLLAKLWSL